MKWNFLYQITAAYRTPWLCPLSSTEFVELPHPNKIPGYATDQKQLNLHISLRAVIAQRPATGWTVRGSNPGEGEIFRTHPDRPWGPTQPPTQRVPGLSRG
jgi:hypothetical protein